MTIITAEKMSFSTACKPAQGLERNVFHTQAEAPTLTFPKQIYISGPEDLDYLCGQIGTSLFPVGET